MSITAVCGGKYISIHIYRYIFTEFNNQVIDPCFPSIRRLVVEEKLESTLRYLED